MYLPECRCVSDKRPGKLGFQKKRAYRDFPGGPVVKTASTAGGAGLTPGGGTGVLHPSRHNQKKEW